MDVGEGRAIFCRLYPSNSTMETVKLQSNKYYVLALYASFAALEFKHQRSEVRCYTNLITANQYGGGCLLRVVEKKNSNEPTCHSNYFLWFG